MRELLDFWIMRTISIIISILLSDLLFAQSAYDEWDRTETILTYYGFSDDQRQGLLIQLADSGNARAMYYLATKYEHPSKSSFELIKTSAEKGYFMAECKLGERYIKGIYCNQNVDSAYYWLNKAIDHTEPYVERDLKLYLKCIKDVKLGHQLSTEYERLATNSLANMIMSQFYMEKGKKEQGLKSAKIGFQLMDRVYITLKKWGNCDDIYKEMLESCWYRANRYMAIAYYVVGDIKKGNKIYPGTESFLSYIECKEPWDYRIAKRIDYEYTYFINGSKSHPIALEFYRKAVEKKSYFALREMINDPSIQSKARQLAISGDSVAAMVYIHHKLAEKDSASANSILKELPYMFNFNYEYWPVFGDGENNIQNYLLGQDDVFYLLKKDALHTDTATILHLMDEYIGKFNHRIDAPKATCLYEILLSQHPDYTPMPILKQNISACYYNISDYKKALPLMMDICDAYPEVYPVIGEILYEGYIGVPNYPKALFYLHKAEKQKESEMKSQTFYYLGMCYLNGNGIEKDERRGFEYMKKAIGCKRVFIKAFHQLSKCYRFERGVKQDLNKAEELLKEASKYGDKDAKSLLDLL